MPACVDSGLEAPFGKLNAVWDDAFRPGSHPRTRSLLEALKAQQKDAGRTRGMSLSSNWPMPDTKHPPALVWCPEIGAWLGVAGEPLRRRDLIPLWYKSGYFLVVTCLPYPDCHYQKGLRGRQASKQGTWHRGGASQR